MSHSSAEALEIQTETHTGIEEPSRWFVQSKRAGCWFRKQTLADQVSQNGLEAIGVALRGACKIVDLGMTCLDVFGNTQCGDHVQAPRRAQIAQ